MHIITGMHRSGTSFVSQALHALGADFGPRDRLFTSDVWNQNGYFENIDVVDVNNRMILGDGATVDYWLTAPESGFARLRNSLASRKWKYALKPSVEGIVARGGRYAGEMRALMDRFEGIHVKDPRFCLTLEAWAAQGRVESATFSFRSPSSVARSIKRREGLPLRMGEGQWLYHVRGFFAQMPGDRPVLLVDFDRFFDPQTQEAAFAELLRARGLPVDAAGLAALRGTLEPRLRTHALPPEDAAAPVRRAYEALRALHAACADGPVRLDDHAARRAAILGR